MNSSTKRGGGSSDQRDDPIGDLLIAGAGGFAREVAWLVDDINRETVRWRVVGFLDRAGEGGRNIMGVPVYDVAAAVSLPTQTHAVVAVGDAKLKERIAEEIGQLGFGFATLVHPTVVRSPSVNIGPGSIICAATVLTVDIEVGMHVGINPSCTVGHDTVIGDFATLAPGCHISGETTIGRSVLIGTGACVVQQTKIGDGTTVGAGAVVVRDLPAGVTAVGVPAKPTESRD